jgi:hypothetical protein
MQSLAPYASYSSWTLLLSGLRIAIPPGRIDSGYLASLGLTGQRRDTIVSALRFLRLVDLEDRPTAALVALVESRGDEYRRQLHNLVLEAYSALFREVDVGRAATKNQLDDYFRKRGAKGSVVRKSSSFFMSLAREADIRLSPHITGVPRRGERAPKSKQVRQLTPSAAGAAEPEPSWRELLIAKFPSLNVEWSEELKREWFASFRELLRILGP